MSWKHYGHKRRDDDDNDRDVFSVVGRGGDGGDSDGGQRQRLALARALFGRPRILVLGEPNANLDTPGEMALRRALAEPRPTGARSSSSPTSRA